MVDDLGNRPLVEASLLPLADALDAAAREVAANTADLRRGVDAALAVGAYEMARTLLEQILAAHLAANIGGHLVEGLRKRIADVRDLRDLQLRRGRR